MKLSIVTTLYQSSRYLEEFYRRITEAASTITDNYELILVNDGSPDDSLEAAKKLLSRDRRIVIVELSRNFGHHRAMMTGLEHTKGDFVFLIDVDLEEDPENLVIFWNYLRTHPEADVVIGEIQTKKQGGLTRRLASSWFYDLFNSLSYVKISNKELVSRLMRRAYVDTLVAYQERELFIPGIWVHAGYNQHYVPAEKTFDGHSTYTLRRKLTMVVEAITSFSAKPLLMVFYTGVMFVVSACLIILYLIISKILFGYSVVGWASLVAILFFIGGMIIFSLGIVGIYTAKIYTEVKQRPKSIVKNVYWENLA
ncbi:glycosyl transferase [Mycobacterium lehmannii]|uniref:Glycosyl transferase n=1 Tax=Mycobacterium lehmannii TaxID=2048550 RepID=A0A101A6N8_9MYCO|nr:glycosyltransferase family 2 protein [Mycobacterium lehmannii]KUI15635.1 glycosyl transferase [Mycobacterium lehmannii]